MINRLALTITFGAIVLGCDASSEGLPTRYESIEAHAKHEQPTDVAVPDTWHMQLHHATIDEIEHGVAIVGYDEHNAVVGKIEVIEAGENIVEIRHEYPRRCEQEYPDAPACFDELNVTVHLSEEWADAWANAPAALFSDRANALAAKLPPDTEEGRLYCALTIAATSAACVGIAVSGPIAAPGCAVGAMHALCKCETFRKAWPQVDWDELCN